LDTIVAGAGPVGPPLGPGNAINRRDRMIELTEQTAQAAGVTHEMAMQFAELHAVEAEKMQTSMAGGGEVLLDLRPSVESAD